MANNIRFVYVSRKVNLPEPSNRDASAVYFVEDTQQLYVGDKLIASHIEPIDVLAYLEDYNVKDVEISGEGSVISDITFDEATGTISITKGDVEVVTDIEDVTESPETLDAGDTIDVVTGVTIENSVLTISHTEFTLPEQITDVIIEADEETGKLMLKVVKTDGTEQAEELSGFATAEQGALAEEAKALAEEALELADEAKETADAAMPSDGGVATNATISLADDPVDAKDAATKQYVDNAVKDIIGVMHYLGVSTTKITDGGQQSPKIKGNNIAVEDLKPGDVVLYSSEHDGKFQEFIWAVDDEDIGYWSEIGDVEVEITIPDGYIIEHIPDGSIEEEKLSADVQEKLNSVAMDPITPPEVDEIVTEN